MDIFNSSGTQETHRPITCFVKPEEVSQGSSKKRGVKAEMGYM